MLFHCIEGKEQNDFVLETGVGWMPSDEDQPDLEGCAEELHVDKESEAAVLLGSLHTLVTLLWMD